MRLVSVVLSLPMCFAFWTPRSKFGRPFGGGGGAPPAQALELERTFVRSFAAFRYVSVSVFLSDTN